MGPRASVDLFPQLSDVGKLMGEVPVEWRVAPSLKPSMFSALRGLFAREPAVAAAVFGKSAVVNGHQELAGDATKSLLQFARLTYYEGALPNCSAWEAELRDAERVLSSHLLRWSGGRLTIARVSAVAEGGAVTKAFAPMISCAEVEGLRGLLELPSIDAELAQVEQRLLDARPDHWAATLVPVRAAVQALVDRTAVRSPSALEAELGSLAREQVDRLGAEPSVWIESLAEELNLAMPGTATPVRGGVGFRSGVQGSRTTALPRTGVEIAVELRGWASLLRDAAPEQSEFWLFGSEDSESVRVVMGPARERDFACLWRARAVAATRPEPLPETGRERVRARAAAWLSRVHGSE